MKNKELEELKCNEEFGEIVTKVKCKPTYNFQSVEFEWEVRCPEDVEGMFEVYKVLLEGLIRVAPSQPGQPAEVEPATEKQLEILKKFKIPHKANISKEEAGKLIKKNIEKNKN